MFKRIYIEISNVCNLSCPFCIQKHETSRYLNVYQFEYILKQIRPYTSYLYLHVLGEPLLHPDLDAILSLCEMYDFHIQLTTNGTVLKEKVSTLQKHRIRQINVSVHSFDWHKDINQDEYLHSIFSSCDTLSENTYISYRLWCLKNGELDSSAKRLLNAMLEYYHITYDEYLRNHHALAHNCFLSFDEVFEWPDLSCAYYSDTGTCRGLKDMIGILSNGDVVPCCLDAYGQAKLGNIFESDLDAILNAEQTQSMIQGFKENKLVHELCQRCQYRTRF